MKMKKVTALMITLLVAATAIGQDITGSWYGALKASGTQLRIVFNISKTDNGYRSTMDSPDQGAYGIEANTTTFDQSKLKIEVAKIGLVYTGELKDTVFTGTLMQGGMTINMVLSKTKIEKVVTVRPQEPKKPYPYRSEEVKFRNETAGIELAGTLTMPTNGAHFPVVVLISGSGPQNRDEELMGHKPFLILSDYLTRNGIAVLRFDDRGTAQSTGNFQTATSDDFATDVEAAIAYLKTRNELNNNQIGLIGHSEGGIIAPLVAAKLKKDVHFIVLMAGTGVPGSQVLLKQQELIARASGLAEAQIEQNRAANAKVFDIITRSENVEKMRADLAGLIPNQSQLDQITSPWMVHFIQYDPVTALRKVSCPVLALNGSLDLQVAPKENLEAIQEALTKSGNKQVTIHEFPGLNHLFQECSTGSPDEYGKIEQTISPKVLDTIAQWILSQTK